MTDTNGGQNSAAPALNCLVQYCKDLSFENPNAPRSLGPQEAGPNISIQVNVNAKQLAEKDFEVEVLLEGSAGEGANVLFKFELTYSGVFRLINIPGGTVPSGRHDRMPAPAVPLCPPDRRRLRAQWRLSAALSRSDRFRRALCAAHAAGAGDAASTSILKIFSQRKNPPCRGFFLF